MFLRQETVVVSDSGRYVPAPVAVVPALKKKTGSGLTRGQTISTAEMLARTSGIEKWEVSCLYLNYSSSNQNFLHATRPEYF